MYEEQPATIISQKGFNPDGIYIERGDEELLGRVIFRSRMLPKNHGYCSRNHASRTKEPSNSSSPPLTRRINHIDELAREQAKLMAGDNNNNRLYTIVIQPMLQKR
jgi:hypothetical protein